MLPIANDYRYTGSLVKVFSNLSIIKDDPTDNIFQNCAVDGKAQFIVSGDAHLLNLIKYNDIEILNAKEFIERISFTK